MLEIPALATGLSALAMLLVLPPKPFLREVAAGVLFGLATQMKLVPVIYTGLTVSILLLEDRRKPTRIASVLSGLGVLGASMLVTVLE